MSSAASREAAVSRLIDVAAGRGPGALDEASSLDIMEAWGIPTVARERASLPGTADAGLRASRLGFPVVLKGIAAGRAHKSDHGLVRGPLGDAPSVEGAASEMLARSRGKLEGFLVQRWVDSVREIACGMVRDPSFGPCVMAGFGGVHAELVDDRCFRVAPLRAADGLAMLEELISRRVLGPYRGSSPADLAALAAVLVSLGELALAFGRVSEVDLNPVMILHDGAPVAVDALVVLGD